MRELKFRAWNTIEKKWESFFYVENDGSYTVVRNGEPYQADNFISVEQFTGLHDKNEKEIYEGDIVSHRNGIKPVVWENEILAFDMCLSDYVPDQEIGVDGEDVEIIGNIHENPELLQNGE